MIYTTKCSENRVFISSPIDTTHSLCKRTICVYDDGGDDDADKDGKVLANETAPNYKQEI